MPTTIEQVEKLHQTSGASYADCKEALDRCGGDVLEALLDLERRGKTAAGGGTYTTRPGSGSARETPSAGAAPEGRQSGKSFDFEALLRTAWATLKNIFRDASANRLEVWRRGELLTSLPVAAVLLLAVVAFPVAFPILLVGLITGCRYQLSGPAVGGELVNDVMDNVSDTVDDVVERVKKELKKHSRKK